MNRLSTMAKAIGMIALAALLIAVPIEIVTAQIPDNPADSLERPAEVIELAPVEIVRAEIPDNPADSLERPAEVIELAPVEIVRAEMPDNPADSLERPAEVIELAPVEIVRAEMPDNPADSLEWPAEVIELAPGETCPDTRIRLLTPEEMELLQGDIDIDVSMPISGQLPPGVWYAHGGWLFYPGGTMVISVTWTPAASVVGLGARCAHTGRVEVMPVTGGFATVGLEFPYGGLFQAVVHNFGPYTISYSGLVDVGGTKHLVRVELAFGETCPTTGIRALTPEEVQLLRGNGVELEGLEVLGGPLGPWMGSECPVRGPTLFTSTGRYGTAWMMEVGRILLYSYTPCWEIRIRALLGN